MPTLGDMVGLRVQLLMNTTAASHVIQWLSIYLPLFVWLCLQSRTAYRHMISISNQGEFLTGSIHEVRDKVDTDKDYESL